MTGFVQAACGLVNRFARVAVGMGSFRARSAAVALALLSLFPATAAWAQSAPTVTASYNSPTVALGGTRVLIVTITNPNTGTDLTGVNLAASALPTNVTFTNLNNPTSQGVPNCASADFSGGALSISGETLAASASCMVTLWARPDVAGTYSYTTGVVSATGPTTLTGATATTSPGLTAYAAPVASSFTYGSPIPHNGGAATATSFSVTDHVTGNPTSFNVGAATSTTGAVSITGAGVVSYTPLAGFSGDDTFTFRATNTGGSSGYATVTVTVLPAAPTVTSLSPTAGPAAGGTAVTITGTGFSGATAVTFGATAATGFTVNSATQITATAPAGTGTVDVRVTTAGGTSSTSAADQYTYVAKPTVTGVSPTAGPTAGGTAVTITGTGFSGTTAVTFGATAATGYTVNSATQITATAPAGTGTVDVRVTNSGGTSATSAADQYTFVAKPTVTSLSPTAGPAAGGTSVVITGTGFSGTTAVTFGATAATGYTVNSATQITATTPAGTGTVDVRVTTLGGTSSTSAADQYTYVAGPSISGLSPAEGVAHATTRPADVTITGSGFSASGNSVTFGGTAGTIVSEGTTSIVVTPPANASGGLVDVAVTASGATATSTNAYRYLLPPTVTVTWSPDAITASQTTLFSVTVTNPNAVALQNISVASSGATTPFTLTAFGQFCGSGNYNASSAFALTGLNLAAGASCTATGTQRGSAGVYQFVTNAPTSAGTATTAVTLTGVAATSNTITVYGTPGLSSITPNSGPLAGGQSVTLTGTNFNGATAVTIDGVAATDVTVVSATSITATTPAGASAGSRSVAITGPAGTGTRSSFYTYNALPTAPTITAPANGGAVLTRPTYSGSFVNAASTVTVFVDGVSIGTVTPASGNSWSLVQPTALAAGSHTVDATATTANGTSAPSATITFTVDATAPDAPVISAPVDGSVTDEATPTISGTAEAGTTVQLSLNGAMPVSVTASGGSWSYTPGSTLPVGPNTLSAIAVDAAGNASAASATVRFTYSPVSITTATLPAGQVGVVYSGIVQASGGTGPYDFAVTSGVLPEGLVLSGGGTLSGTPSANGSIAFTVTATDANGLSASRAYTVAVARPADPVVTDVSDVEVTADPATPGEPTMIDLSAAVQNATRIEIVTPPVHGLATVNGFEVTYTPAIGYFGADSFAYRAVGFDDGGMAPPAPAKGDAPASAVSGPATVSINIAAPTLVLTGGTVPSGQIGVAYSRVLTTSGGTAPYTYAVTGGTLPVGITLATDGTLSGSPTEGGTFSFTVTATDSSTGTGPFSVSALHDLVIDAPALTVTPSALPDATTGEAYNQTFATTGGVAPYSYAVTAGALPGGLTLSSTGVLSGTVTEGGAFGFTVSATDSSTGAGPYTAAQPVTLTVTASTIAVTPASLASGTRGVAYAATVAASGGVAPYSYALASGALPAGLTLSPAGEISGTPMAVGSFAFQVRATDSATGAGPYSGVADMTLTIGAASLTVTPTTLPDGLAGVSWSQQLQASGGQGGYSFSVTAGALPQGLTLSTAGLLSGKPTTAGTFAFTVTATDGFGNTGLVALSVTVAGRPDPGADPDVRGLNTAQAEAARRMVGSQLDNFGRRLEQLHRGGEGPAGAAMNLTLDGSAFTPLDEGRQSLGELGQIVGRDDSRRDMADRDQLNRMLWGDRAGDVATGGSAKDRLNAGPQAGGDSEAYAGPRIWAGGAISLGERDATTQTARMAITTSGISVGVDMSVADNLDVGVGVGFGQENTDVGRASSRMEADSRVAVAYGSWRPSGDVFVDGILGYGDLGFDMRRRTPVDSSLVFGQRDGSAVFGSLSAGLDRAAGPARWSSYGRVELLNADLDAYVETGSPVWALSYEARSVESVQGVLGLRYEREVLRGQDHWTPGIRLEWSHEFGDAGAQTLRYADWLDGPGYAIGQEGWERSRFNLGLSLGWRSQDGWSWTSEYEGTFSNGEMLNGLRIKGSRLF